MKRLNVAIAGCGWVADWHARDGLAHIPQLFALTACCDTDATKLNAFAQRYGIANALADFADLLARPDIDVVVIATPPGCTTTWWWLRCGPASTSCARSR
jgi:predicted dehydrogenase